MNMSRYFVCAAGFFALLATSYLYSQQSFDQANPYTALSELPGSTSAVFESQLDFCFNDQLVVVSCEYETMLGASGNAADVLHVVMPK
jgi:hypothetical protein